MNPEKPSPPPDDFESKITALLLGELSPADADAVQQAIAADPALTAVRDRLQQTLTFVREAVAQPAASATSPATQPRLSAKRRERLLRHFRLIAPLELASPQRRWWTWLVPMSAAAVLILLVAGSTLSANFGGRTKSMAMGRPAIINYLGGEKVLREQMDTGTGSRPVEQEVRGKPPGLQVQTAPSRPKPSRGAAETATETAARPEEPAAVAGRPMMDMRMLMRYGLLPKGIKAAESGEPAAPAQRAEGRNDDAAGLAKDARVLRRHPAAAPAPSAAARSELAPLPSKLPLPAFMGTPTDFAFGDTGAKAKHAQPQATGLEEPAQVQMQSWAETDGGFPVVQQNTWNFDAQPTLKAEEKYGEFGGMGGGGGFTGGGYGAAGGAGGRIAGDAVIGQRVENAPADGDPARRLFRTMASNARGAVGDSSAGAAPPEDRPVAVTELGFAEAPQQLVEALQQVAAAPGLVPTAPPATPAPPPTAAVPLASMATSERFAAGASGYGALVREGVPAVSGDYDNDGSADIFVGVPVRKGVAEVAKVPVLGDVPVLGRLFRESKAEADFWVLEGALGKSTESLGLAAESAGKPVQLAVRRADQAGGEDRARLSEELGRKVDGSERGRTDEKLGEAEGRTADGQPGKAGVNDLRALALNGSATVVSKFADQMAVANGVARGAEPQAPTTTLFDKAALSAALVTNALTVVKAGTVAQGVALAPEEKVVSRPLAPPPEPQPEVATAANPFSTFSLNVTDVSFKLAAASLEKGALPEAARIRSEEFLNAFNYRDPEPARGAPIAFAWERARYPFAHNREAIRFSVQTAARGRAAAQPLNLVLLLDSSGSMERADRVSIIREALAVLAQQLKPQDRISVVAFARTARAWVLNLPGNQANEALERVGNLTPEGGTNLEDALSLAYQTAARYFISHGLNRVVLLTDGAANLGDVDPESLTRKVEAARKQGIALDCFGIGWEGYNDDLIEVLSSHGDGRYGFINSPEEAATEFVGQLAGALQVAAADVKVQVEFNPHRATAWRQIGYAKHQLTKEQFRDNTVDAAELGATESGNALYLLEVNPLGQGDIGTVRVRYREPASGLYCEHAWRVPYTGPEPILEQSSPAMRLAVTAAGFSEWLASSPFAGEVNPDRLLGTMFGVTDAFSPDERPKRLEAMIRQAKSISGQ